MERVTSSPAPEKIAKLPLWAQEHITSLRRERDEAVRSLLQFRDFDTPSPFWFEDHPCIGTSKGPDFIKRYVQTYYICIEHQGVLMRISTHEQDGISVSYGDSERLGRAVALVPKAYQQFDLLTKENMRS